MISSSPAGSEPNSTLLYRIDEHERIAYVNDAWNRFAEANRGEGIVAQAILGQNLWKYISDETTRYLYRLAIDRVRRGGGDLSFTFRCDSPERKRLLIMDIRARESNVIEFETCELWEQHRIGMAIKPLRSPLRMCSWCNRFDEGERWVELEDYCSAHPAFEYVYLPQVSHGICGDCHQMMLLTIQGAG